MPGICTSAIRQSVLAHLSDSRKSWAHGNASEENPVALIRLMVASRTDSSSSTIEIIGLFAISTLIVADEANAWHQRAAIAYWAGAPAQTSGSDERRV